MGVAIMRGIEPLLKAPGLFADAPTSYILISTHTESQTIVAPEDGWYQLEIHGQSGSGGTALARGDTMTEDGNLYSYKSCTAGGGGGGSGAYVLSNLIKLNEGDTIIISYDASGNITVEINSSTEEVYDTMKATSATNGSNARITDYGDEDDETFDTAYAGGAGKGGKAEGGNVTNLNGNDGKAGSAINEKISSKEPGKRFPVSGGAGGAAVVEGGNAGGSGGSVVNYDGGLSAPGPVKSGFVNFYRGNTNVVAQEV